MSKYYAVFAFVQFLLEKQILREAWQRYLNICYMNITALEITVTAVAENIKFQPH